MGRPARLHMHLKNGHPFKVPRIRTAVFLKYKQPSDVPMNTRKTAFHNRDSPVMDVGSDSETQLLSLDMLATDQRPNAPFIISNLIRILGCLPLTNTHPRLLAAQ